MSSASSWGKGSYHGESTTCCPIKVLANNRCTQFLHPYYWRGWPRGHKKIQKGLWKVGTGQAAASLIQFNSTEGEAFYLLIWIVITHKVDWVLSWPWYQNRILNVLLQSAVSQLFPISVSGVSISPRRSGKTLWRHPWPCSLLSRSPSGCTMQTCL
jgi:hypothetical protein